MPRKRSARIPKYRLHKPTKLAVVRLNGRDIYLGKHGTEESRQRYEQVIADQRLYVSQPVTLASARR